MMNSKDEFDLRIDPSLCEKCKGTGWAPGTPWSPSEKGLGDRSRYKQCDCPLGEQLKAELQKNLGGIPLPKGIIK